MVESERGRGHFGCVILVPCKQKRVREATRSHDGVRGALCQVTSLRHPSSDQVLSDLQGVLSIRDLDLTATECADRGLELDPLTAVQRVLSGLRQLRGRVDRNSVERCGQ